jgi:EAL domain-containing protein (putative c-di-GMP-specific phosphodiesterase class I)
MMQSGINEAIVKTIIELAQSLKMQVVAEGIETQEQFEQLRSWGCEFGQGYFLARPLRCDDAERLISRQTFPIAFTDFEGVDVYKTGGTDQRAH